MADEESTANEPVETAGELHDFLQPGTTPGEEETPKPEPEEKPEEGEKPEEPKVEPEAEPESEAEPEPEPEEPEEPEPAREPVRPAEKPVPRESAAEKVLKKYEDTDYGWTTEMLRELRDAEKEDRDYEVEQTKATAAARKFDEDSMDGEEKFLKELAGTMGKKEAQVVFRKIMNQKNVQMLSRGDWVDIGTARDPTNETIRKLIYRKPELAKLLKGGKVPESKESKQKKVKMEVGDLGELEKEPVTQTTILRRGAEALSAFLKPE